MTTLFLAMERELLVVRGGGGTGWRAERRLPGLRTSCVAADPFDLQRVHCGTFGRGMWRSVDAGDTWMPVGDAGAVNQPWDGAGIAHPKVTAAAVAPLEPGVVYAGTEPSALFRSDDGGESWRELPALRELPSAPTWSFPPRPYTSHVRWIAPDPLVPGRVSLALEAGALVHTGDGGRTWGDRRPGAPVDTHTAAPVRSMPGRLLVAAGDGYFESPDGGTTWLRPDEGLPHTYLWGLAADEAGDVTLVSGAPDAFRAHGLRGTSTSSIHRRAGAEPWRPSMRGLPPAEGTIAPILAAHGPAFYALTNRGLFVSLDRALSWDRIPIPWSDDLARQHPQALAVVG